MSESSPHGLANGMKWTARIIAIMAVVLFGSMLISEAIARILQDGWGAAVEPLPELISHIGIGILAVAGCVLAWRREQLAGILLVLTSAALAAHISLFQGAGHLYAWSRVGFPCLVAGALLLISRWLSKPTDSEGAGN